MSRQTINNTFTLNIPDSFEPMSSTELNELSRQGGDPYRWGVRDREKHIMFVVLWKQVPAILGWLADLNGIVKRNEQLTRKAYANHDYQLRKFDSMQAGKVRTEGYQFSYSAQGIKQNVTNFLIKDGKIVYSFMWVGREVNMAEDQALFHEVMESLQHV